MEIIHSDLNKALRLQRTFKRYRAQVSQVPLRDFSGFHCGTSVYCHVSPQSERELAEIVRISLEERIRLRIRGNGHSLNGSSLPHAGELVVRTGDMTRARLRTDHLVYVEAGAILWSVDEWLGGWGRSLPVFNDGYAGPSLGGYISAGGLGPGSTSSGWFWDNVVAVTLVDGQGAIVEVSRDLPLFAWLFGSMGQLGIVAGATLNTVIRPAGGHSPLSADVEGDTSIPKSPLPPDEAGKLFWFTLLVKQSDFDRALTDLTTLEARFADDFYFRGRYTYRIKYSMPPSPLVWPLSEPCIAVGTWGIPADPAAVAFRKVQAFDAAFTKLVLTKGYRRYLQTEVLSGPEAYKLHFGDKLYSRFGELKKSQDPCGIFNHGSVFSA